VIQHDLLFIHSFLPVNWAIRECGNLLPKLKWLHWQHSAPSPKPDNCEYPLTGCYQDMPNSIFIYLNRTDISRVANRYSIEENRIYTVHNFINFERLFNLHPVTSELVDKYDLLDADTICVYPTRLVEPKQPEKIIKLMEQLKKTQKVRLIICNSWSNGKEEIAYKNKLQTNTSLTPEELIFTSSFNSKWCKDNNFNIQLGVPREVVVDLMRLSDLFILPSNSECCSMIMLEAIANKNLIVLNDDLLSLHEFGGQKMNGNNSTRALYMQFGSISRPIVSYNPSEEAWYRENALALIRAQEQDQSIQFFKFVRKRHNPKWVYFNELRPLLNLSHGK
jgi:glycosyltransferase involved in cell wall biosynthesis